MPPKRKFNSRFPSARIKKIMQSDEDIGKVSAPVPLVVSRAVEVFLEALLSKAQEQLDKSRTASRTLSPVHLKRCIETEPKFDFLRGLVQHVTDNRPSTPEIMPQSHSIVMNNSHRDPRIQTASSITGSIDSSEMPKRKRGRPLGSGKKSGDGTSIKKTKPQLFNPDGTPYKPRRGRKSKAWKEAIARGENPLLIGHNWTSTVENPNDPDQLHMIQPLPLELTPQPSDTPTDPKTEGTRSEQIREEVITTDDHSLPAPTNSTSSSCLIPTPLQTNNFNYNMSSIINNGQSDDDDYDS
ncbi:DNA polymerase epsilon subunit C [Oopsacas minuta]|uniref:DNA polymerase epsilon subunit C n=1 Tax=Oopsacas minuta TaxID=111878 RepID=A0AAV7K237_9METZ|nr:DNA polymerase epsilon subunit C [Oopsacas minuta]